MNRYPDKVWRLFRNPRRAGGFAADLPVRQGRATTPAGHAVIEMQLLVSSDGRIEDAQFRALGCPYLIATGAWLCAHVIGRRSESVQELESRLLVEQLELPALKRYCAVMAVEALSTALAKEVAVAGAQTQHATQTGSEDE